MTIRSVLLTLTLLSVWAAFSDEALATCTKDEVLKLIDKGYDKRAIDVLCAGTAAPVRDAPAQPAAPATDAVSVIGALLKLVETAPLDNNEQLDKSFAALGLSFSGQPGERRSYDGVLTDISVKAHAELGTNHRQFILSDTAPARDTSLKDKYYVALKAAQIFAAQHGWSLAEEHEQPRAWRCTQKEFGSEKKIADGSGAKLIVAYNLGSMIPRYSCDDGTPKDADSYSDGNFALIYERRNPR